MERNAEVIESNKHENKKNKIKKKRYKTIEDNRKNQFHGITLSLVQPPVAPPARHTYFSVEGQPGCASHWVFIFLMVVLVVMFLVVVVSLRVSFACRT
jgi:hypothetical protein